MFKKNLREIIPAVIKWIEKGLATGVILGVIIYIVSSVAVFWTANWQSKETFYDLIYRVLLVTIGLELARMLVTHSFLAILELLAFVVARKMLKPDLTAVDIVLGTLAFVSLLGAYRYFVVPIIKLDSDENKTG